MYVHKDAESPEMDEEIKGFQFSEVTIRQAFVRKVYAILLLQLLITFGMAALFTFHEPSKLFVWNHVEIVIVCMIAAFIMVIVLACCDVVRRRHPMNLIFLFLFTIAEAVVIGFICSGNKQQHVLMAVGITAVICFSLTVFAFQTKYDFTGWGPFLYILLIGLVLLGFLLMFVPNKPLDMIYSAGGAVLFAFYLIYDTQLMLGGNHKYAISPEEHIFAALNLYLDIINLFLHILRAMK